MSDDEDQIRRFMPLLRRIIVFVAVLTAVPVTLWTITAFVHGFVGQPRLPVFRQLAAANPADVPVSTIAAATPGAAQPTVQAGTVDPASSTLEAKLTTTDAAPAPKGPLGAARAREGNADSQANATTSAVIASPADGSGKPTGAPTPPVGSLAAAEGASSSTGALAMEQPPAAASDTDDTLGGEPLVGPIPLPRHRPRDLALARIPMPRPRPAAIESAAAETTSGPVEWLNNIFTSGSHQ